MKKYTIFSLLILFLSQASWSGPGNTSGGDGITSTNGVSFRDLSEHQCRWISGIEFAKQIPELNKILTRIGELNFYLPDQFQDQINRVTICPYEGALRLLNTEDSDKTTNYVFQDGSKKIQLGLRRDNLIWISMPYFRKLEDPKHKYSPEQLKAYFFLHELSHGLIPQGISMRNEKVKSFVAALATARNSEELERQMVMSGVHYYYAINNCDYYGSSGGNISAEFIENSDTMFKQALKTLRSGKFGKSARLAEDNLFKKGFQKGDKYRFFRSLTLGFTLSDLELLKKKINHNLVINNNLKIEQFPYCSRISRQFTIEEYLTGYAQAYLSSKDQDETLRNMQMLYNDVQSIAPELIQYVVPPTFSDDWVNSQEMFEYITINHPKLISLMKIEDYKQAFEWLYNLAYRNELTLAYHNKLTISAEQKQNAKMALKILFKMSKNEFYRIRWYQLATSEFDVGSKINWYLKRNLTPFAKDFENELKGSNMLFEN